MSNTVFGPDPEAVQAYFITPSDFNSSARVYNFIIEADSYALLKPPIAYPFLSVYSESLLYFRLLESDTDGNPSSIPSAADGPSTVPSSDNIVKTLSPYRFLYDNTFLDKGILPVVDADGTPITETTQKWMFISSRHETEVVLEFKKAGVF